MAAPPPSDFFNPFHPGHYVSEPIVSLPEKGHAGTPDGDVPLAPEPTTTLKIIGQGTVAVSSNAKGVLNLSVLTDVAGDPTLRLAIGASEILFYSENTGGQEKIPFTYTKSEDACFINSGIRTTYWLSLDTPNGRLRYGKYYTNKAMTLIEANLKYQNDEGVMVWTEPQKFAWLENVKTVQAWQDNEQTGTLTPIIHPLPVVIDRPPFVLPPDQVTLQDLDQGTYTAPINLPESCQALYGNVAGTKIVLNDDDFPQFAEAIQYSCVTEGCWAFEKLKKKAGEFTKDKNGTYLRITLGYNLGDSPGIPFVLEIWPGQHYSPIHDHGNACAVIKVLHGSINCTWYDSLKQEPVKIGSANLTKGDVTWIGDNNYQIHKLFNPTPTVCCTIQCYRYAEQDNVHYDGFNWVDDNGKVSKFVPNSDKAFLEFRAIMKREWEEASKKGLVGRN